MIPLEAIRGTGHFREITLKSGDVLFSEGECDGNFYIIYSGELIIRRSLATQTDEYRELARLPIGSVVGESSLLQNDPKEVEIRASQDTVLLSITGGDTFKQFVQNYPDIGYELLITVVDTANRRLLRANHEITANYAISLAISQMESSSLQTILDLLAQFKKILSVDEVIFLERNIASNEYFKLRLCCRKNNTLQNTLIHFPNGEFSKEILESEGVKLKKYSVFLPLTLGDKNYGFLGVSKGYYDFSENELKLLQNTAASFVGIIHQKRVYENERNKKYESDFL